MIPGVVPKEKVALVTVVSTVTPATLTVNVAVWLRNGLCGPLPAIEALALEYRPPAPGGPMINPAGPINPRASNCRPPATLLLRPHPVDPVEPRVEVPPEFTVICCPELEANVPVVAPLLSTKSKSLISCATSVGFANRSVSTTVTVPEPVVTVAEALTGPPLVLLPDGVIKVITLA